MSRRHYERWIGYPGLNVDGFVARKLATAGRALPMKLDLDRVGLAGVRVLQTRNRARQGDVRTQPPNIIGILGSSVAGDGFDEDAGIACETGITRHERTPL